MSVPAGLVANKMERAGNGLAGVEDFQAILGRWKYAMVDVLPESGVAGGLLGLARRLWGRRDFGSGYAECEYRDRKNKFAYGVITRVSGRIDSSPSN
jgi:hypothetical protein